MPGSKSGAPLVPPRAAVRLFFLLALVPISLGLAGRLGFYLMAAADALRVPTELEYGEPFIASASWNLATGGSLYAPVTGLPFIHNNYNPLALVLLAPVYACTGPSFVPMRALAIASTLLLLLVVGLLVRRETGSMRAAWLAGLLPLSCGFVYLWLLVGRVDTFAALLGVSGAAWAFAHREGSERSRWWFVPLAVAAFAAKQTAIGGTAAVLLYALLRGRRREAITQGLVVGAGCGLVMLVANVLTNGQYWLHAVVYNAAHDRGGLWPEGLPPGEMFRDFGPTLLILLAAALPYMRWRQDAPWIIWLAITFPLAFWAVRKSGSHPTYFLEAVCAASVLALTVLWRAWRTPATGRLRIGILGACLVLAAAGIVPGAHWDWQRVKFLDRSVAWKDPLPPEVRAAIAGAEGEPLLLAKLAGHAIESGRPAVFDLGDMIRAQDLGNLDVERDLLPLVRGRHFGVIGVHKWPADYPYERQFDTSILAGFLEAVEASYEPIADLKEGTYWVPRK